MLFFLLLTRTYIPNDIRTVITGSGFAINFSSYIPINKISLMDSILNKFDFQLTNVSLDSFGIKSDSTIYNILPFFISLIIASILHLFVYFLNKWTSNCKTDIKWGCCLRRIIKLITIVYNIMTFGYYIRALIQISQYLLVSSLSEILAFNGSTGLRKVSLVFAFCMLFLLISLIVLSLCLAWSKLPILEKRHKKLGEFFIGLK